MTLLRIASLLLATLALTSPLHAQALAWRPAAYLGLTSARMIASHHGGSVAIMSDNEMYVSSDHGMTWRRTGYPRPSGNQFHLYGLAFDSTGALLAGGHGANRIATLFRTRDLGGAWDTLPYVGRSAAAIAVEADGALLVGGPTAPLQRSTDGGATWRSLPLTSVMRIAARPDGLILAAAHDDGGVLRLVRSTDRGATFTPATLAFGAAIQPNALAFADVSTIFAAVDVHGGPSILLRSIDDGRTFTRFVTGDTDRVSSVAAVGGVVLLGSRTHGLRRSTDGGGTWSRTSFPHSDVRLIATSSPAHVQVAGSTGPYYSGDAGLTWSTLSEQIDDASINSIAVGGDGALVVSTFLSGAFRTTNPFGPWSWDGPTGEDTRGAVTASDGSLILPRQALTPALRRRPDGSWHSIELRNVGQYAGYRAAAAGRDGRIAIATPSGNLFVSTNSGETFRRVPQDALSESGQTTSLVIDHGGSVWMLSDQGVFVLDTSEERVRTVTTWSALAHAPRVLAVGDDGRAVIFGASYATAGAYGTFRTTADGFPLEKLPAIPFGYAPVAAVVDAAGAIHVAVTTLAANEPRSTVLRLRARPGSTWENVGPSFDQHDITALVRFGDRLALTSSAFGVYVADNASAVDLAEHVISATTITALAGTDATVRLRVTIAATARCRIVLHDASGAERATLLDETLAAGATNVERAAGDIPSGLYWATLDVDGARVTAPVRIVR